MRIGIIGPCEDEIMPLIEKISNKKSEFCSMLTFYSGLVNNIEVVALYCGVCKVNAAIAAQILVDKFNVTHIIVTGVAGAIHKGLSLGDTVISTEIGYHDVDKGILTEYHPWMDSVYFKADDGLVTLCRKIVSENEFPQNIFFGRLVTGEAFISDSGREVIIKEHDPLCVDMETASVAHVCYANKIPFIAIRSMSDTEEHYGVDNFEKNCKVAANNSLLIVEKILEELNK